MALSEFRAKVQTYRRQAGFTQKALAAAIGLNPDVLSHKFNGISDARLTHAEVRQIVKILAQWEAIGTQDQAIELLELMGLGRDTFAPPEWGAPPLKRLDPAPPRVTPMPLRMASLAALPTAFTPLIGRADEIQGIVTLLHDATIRLVTLSGVGGVGKTRLAVCVAEEIAGSFPQGATFVSLATISDPALVPLTILRALGASIGKGSEVRETLRNLLADRSLLLVLDNVEQVLGAADLIVDLLTAAPRITVLATSRVPLHLYGEHVFPVPPLALPPPGAPVTSADIGTYAAIALFLARARAVRPDFAPTAKNLAAIGVICARLHGIPLAIELAAARLQMYTPEGILSKLEHSLGILAGGPRNLPERQQSLRNTLAWSYDLLPPEAQAVFAQLGVFVGGWTIAAAAAVCQGVDTVSAALDLLLDHGLIEIDRQSEESRPRQRFLEPIRTYALEKLGNGRVAQATRARHLAAFLALVEAAEPELIGPDQSAWVDQLDADFANVRAALHWAEATERMLDYARICAAIWRFAWLRGYVPEMRGWLNRASARPELPTQILSRVERGASTLALAQGDYAIAEHYALRSRDHACQANDQRGNAGALHNLGVVAAYRGDYPAARRSYEESLALHLAIGDQWGAATTRNNLGEVHFFTGELEAARLLHTTNLQVRRELGDLQGIASSLANLGSIANSCHADAEATMYFEEALTRFRQLGDKLRIAIMLTNLSGIVGEAGRHDLAENYLREGLALRRDLGDKRGIALTLLQWAGIKATLGEYAMAAQILAALETLRTAIDAPFPPAERQEYADLLATLQNHLDPTALDVALTRGRVRALAEILADLLQA